MISAPLRTTKSGATTKSRTSTPQTEPQPNVRLHGHLALLEWDETETRPAVQPAPFGLARSAMDRCYDGGTLVLLAVTVAALAATLGRF